MPDNSPFRQPRFLGGQHEPIHRIRCAVHGFIRYSNAERQVIDHRLFRRLRYIRQCGKAERSVAEASQLQNRSLGLCDGFRPWLGPLAKERCNEPNRLLIRTASNAYFPQKLTVISLPDRDQTVNQIGRAHV